MLSDLTIYLEPPILGGGGTVIIVPRMIAAIDWKSQEGRENPAASDPYLKSNKPLPPDGLRLGAIISDKVSIVQFDYPEGGTYKFRFAPARGSTFPWDMLKTKHIGTGSEGEELDPSTGQIIKVGSALHIHIVGKDVTEADSRIVESVINIGSLQSRYDCRNYELVLVCDASKDLQK
ncbi:hypothetical protein C9413_18890 [Rhizobium sp. SEMIA 4085]|nr:MULTISPECIES: hypothetical protein [Rhizobium]NNH31489.1 hypothetical protein [Rhizobium sp. SEMIA 4085]